MCSSIPENYLETEVLTATPQRRQLMLIEAAIRFVERTRRHWQAGENDEACETLVRAQQVTTELLAALNSEVHPDLVKKVAAIYLFVFRALVDAHLHHDEKKLDDALRVLEIERETWREMCEKLGSTVAPEPQSTGSSDRQEPGPQRPPLPDLGTDSPIGPDTSTGLSLEA